MKYQNLSYAIAISMGLLTTPLALAGLNDSLIAYYPFNGNAQDASGNGNNGTVNGATLTEDRFGNPESAYYFGGYVQAPRSESLSITGNELTMSVWIKQSDRAPNAYIIVNRGNTGSPSPRYALDIPDGGSNGKLRFMVGSQQLYSNTTIPIGEWVHIVAVYQQSTRKIYLNGILDSQNAMGGEIGGDKTDLFIGSYLGGGGFFDGIIDDIRIYNRTLSEDEIQALYAAVPDDGDCVHATYSLKKRTLTVPFVEMPVVDFLTGQPTGEIELWTGSLKQVLGTTNRFRLLNKTVAQITDGSSSSCPATYAVETGTLSIPYIDVSTGIVVGDKKIENGVDVFKATMTWDPIGRSFVVQEVEQLSSTPKTPKSCADLKANDAAATDGIYEIDPDGTGSHQPFEVYCDMTTDDGGWTLIFRHDASEGYFSGVNEAVNVNQNNPGLSTKKYSILNQLESFRREGKFQFRINWPGYTQRNIWTQTSNPTEDVNVAGYQGISVDSTSNHWGGLEFGNGSHDQINNNSSYLDGSVNHWNWYYAIGSYRQWGATEGCYNALPAADDVAGYHCGVQTVELWVK